MSAGTGLLAEQRRRAAEAWWGLGEKVCSDALTCIVDSVPEGGALDAALDSAVSLLAAFAPGYMPEAAVEPEAASEVRCRHEWYHGRCIHCEIEASTVRRSATSPCSECFGKGTVTYWCGEAPMCGTDFECPICAVPR